MSPGTPPVSPVPFAWVGQDTLTKAERDRYKQQYEDKSAVSPSSGDECNESPQACACIHFPPPPSSLQKFAAIVDLLTLEIDKLKAERALAKIAVPPLWQFKPPSHGLAATATGNGLQPFGVGCAPDDTTASSHSSSPEKARGEVIASRGGGFSNAVTSALKASTLGVAGMVAALLEQTPPAEAVRFAEQAAATLEQNEQNQPPCMLPHALAVEFTNRRKWRAQRDVLHAAMSVRSMGLMQHRLEPPTPGHVHALQNCGGECRNIWNDNYAATKVRAGAGCVACVTIFDYPRCCQ